MADLLYGSHQWIEGRLAASEEVVAIPNRSMEEPELMLFNGESEIRRWSRRKPTDRLFYVPRLAPDGAPARGL